MIEYAAYRLKGNPLMHPSILFAGFFFFAVTYNLLGPLTPDIMASTGMSLSDSGTLMSFQQVGSVLAILASLWYMKRVRQSLVMRLGYFILIVALVLIAFSTGKPMLFILYAFLGIGAFLVDTGSNATLSTMYFEKRATYIPLLHFCYSAGAIATGYLILPFKGPQWRMAYALVGVLLTVIFILGLLDQHRRKRLDAQSTNSRISPQELPSASIIPCLKDPAFLLYALVIALYMGSQIICSAWIPVYVELELGQPPSMVATSLTMFWVGTAISRLLIGPLMNNGGKPFVLSIIGLTVAGLALIAATLSTNMVFVFTCIALCGFFAGSTIPMFIVVTSTWYPRNTAFISLSYILVGTFGRMLFPWLVTKIATYTSLGFSLALSSSLLIAAAVLLIPVSARHQTDRP